MELLRYYLLLHSIPNPRYAAPEVVLPVYRKFMALTPEEKLALKSEVHGLDTGGKVSP